jgi:hypothetical protein
MPQLPAYQGAPYRQPRPPPRKRRALRILLRAGIAAAVLLLFIITGALLAHAAVP